MYKETLKVAGGIAGYGTALGAGVGVVFGILYGLANVWYLSKYYRHLP